MKNLQTVIEATYLNKKIQNAVQLVYSVSLIYYTCT